MSIQLYIYVMTEPDVKIIHFFPFAWRSHPECCYIEDEEEKLKNIWLKGQTGDLYEICSMQSHRIPFTLYISLTIFFLVVAKDAELKLFQLCVITPRIIISFLSIQYSNSIFYYTIQYTKNYPFTEFLSHILLIHSLFISLSNTYDRKQRIVEFVGHILRFVYPSMIAKILKSMIQQSLDWFKGAWTRWQ